MSDLKSRGASTSLSLRRNSGGDKRSSITTVKKKATTSYKVPPLTLRLSIRDKQRIADWVDEVQEGAHHNVSPAKLYRALVEVKENMDDKELESLNIKLAEVIDKMV